MSRTILHAYVNIILDIIFPIKLSLKPKEGVVQRHVFYMETLLLFPDYICH